MKNITSVIIALLLVNSSIAQIVRDHRDPKTIKPPADVKKPVQAIVLYEHANYAGQAKTIGVGQYRLTDFNDITSSIKVPVGMVAIIYEHAADNQGYGIWVDLLEDRPDLSLYNFSDKVSYVNVFYVNKDNYVWARNAKVNGQFIAGHWERKRATPLPPNTVAVVAPPLAPTNPSVLAVNGPTTTITSLGVQSSGGRILWATAVNDQQGIIGNDFRGREEIGSAAFERASNNIAIPDNLNFWYPQKRQNDVGYFKRTLAGRVKENHQVNIAGTFKDYDVNIDIIPHPKYMYLINEGHRREYNDLMSKQWNLSFHQSGQPNCDDPKSISSFDRVEAEIAEDYWPQGDHLFGRARLADLVLIRGGEDMCVYGPWIYDKGHCCQPEIHPAEQLWWNVPQGNGKRYYLNVICDASRRFWWRQQMDDGTKLKPWGAPPIKGLFAIAFEYTLPLLDAVTGYTTKQFELGNIQHHNVIEYPNADQVYNLVYQNKNIVSFIPHNNAFKVSFEHVGVAPGEPDKIRGFLVIETSVGVTTQIATAIVVLEGGSPKNGGVFTKIVNLPANSTPEQAPQQYEDRFFKKEKGHYYFTILETNVSNTIPPVIIE
jgi:hypothetical protein